jgi:hypothetical protein
LSQPVAGTLTQLLYAFHASNACGQVWTEEACVSCFVSQSPYGSEVLINSVSRQAEKFQGYAVTNHNNAIEGDSWFRTVPGHKFLDGVLVDSSRGRRREAAEHGHLRMIQIGQSQNDATE